MSDSGRSPSRKVTRRVASPSDSKPGWKLQISRFFLVSVIVHVGFGVAAAFFVVQNIQTKRKMTFKEGPPVVNATHRAIEHKVSMVQKKKTGGAPPQNRRIVSTGISAISLPEMPRMPSSTLMTPSAMPGMSGAGFGAGAGAGAVMSPSTAAGRGSVGGGFSFFGFRGATGSILYVVDISGSMILGNNDRTSYERLEQEVITSLSALSPAMKFNVITFATDVFVYQRTMVAATPMEKEKAIKWLKSYSPCLLLANGQLTLNQTQLKSPAFARHGGTSSKMALKKSFQLAPDTIVFVSDGEPKDDQRDKIWHMAKEQQELRTKKAVINTFAYKAISGKEFMEKLAKDNGGRYTDVK